LAKQNSELKRQLRRQQDEIEEKEQKMIELE
jgi:hypothetical protein